MKHLLFGDRRTKTSFGWIPTYYCPSEEQIRDPEWMWTGNFERVVVDRGHPTSKMSGEITGWLHYHLSEPWTVIFQRSKCWTMLNDDHKTSIDHRNHRDCYIGNFRFHGEHERIAFKMWVEGRCESTWEFGINASDMLHIHDPILTPVEEDCLASFDGHGDVNLGKIVW